MPKLVNQLDLKNRSELTNSFQVLTTDPTSFEIYRTPVSNFRGASVFVSKNEPSVSPEDPTLNEYVGGDVYIQESSEGLLYYSWDKENSTWKSETKLNGLRVLTATDFPDEINLDLRDTNFTSDKAFADDYYLNKTLQLLFKYSATLGFQFGTTSYQGYETFRAPTVFQFEGDDVVGYTDPKTYLQTFLSGSAPDLEKRKYSLPVFNDNIHITLQDDEGHGGWVWFWKTDRPVADPNNALDNYNEKLGVDIDGTDTTNRFHFREAKTWNDISAPVQNDKKYRQGDNVFVTTAGVLYYNYQEGLPDNTTDLGALFEGQTILSGSSLKTAQDGSGNWVTPTANDSEYQEGDYILTKNLGTPRIHGPYKFGSASDLEAWPLYAVLRSPVEHQFDFETSETSGFNLPTSFAGDYPINSIETVETMIADGDKALLNYSDSKAYVLRDDVSVDIAAQTLDWGDLSKRINLHPVTIQTSTAVGEPSVDIEKYYNGVLVRNKNGDLFKFNEDFTDYTNSSFEQMEGLRANVTHVVETTSGQYTPPTDNGNAEWGSATVIDGDTLEVRCVAADADKVVLFTADVNEATGEITWVDRRSKYGTRTLVNKAGVESSADGFVPNGWNSQITMVEGDLVITDIGAKYVYNEDYENSFANPRLNFVEWVRPVKTLLASGNTVPANLIDPLPFADYIINFNGDTPDSVMPKIGDVVRFEYTEVDGVTKTGKVLEKRCTTERPYAFSEWENPKVVKYWTEASVGRNNADDSKYSAGDFMDNPSTEWRYGPYVEDAPDNATAWPDFLKLTQTAEYVDATTAKVWEIEVDDDEFYFLEK